MLCLSLGREPCWCFSLCCRVMRGQDRLHRGSRTGHSRLRQNHPVALLHGPVVSAAQKFRRSRPHRAQSTRSSPIEAQQRAAKADEGTQNERQAEPHAHRALQLEEQLPGALKGPTSHPAVACEAPPPTAIGTRNRTAQNVKQHEAWRQTFQRESSSPMVLTMRAFQPSTS